MAIRNHSGKFRPVRGGIAILNSQLNQSGTLGLVATTDGNDAWLLSAFHVLCPQGQPTNGQRIFQPFDGGAGDEIAVTEGGRADMSLDCAAARLAVPSVPEILGIGPIQGAIEPVVGMQVMKSGMATGVTQGVIERVVDDDVRIKVMPGFPGNYSLSEGSDSGAIWVTVDTRQPVVLHTAGNDTGIQFAAGRVLVSVLARLGLQVAVTARVQTAAG